MYVSFSPADLNKTFKQGVIWNFILISFDYFFPVIFLSYVSNKPTVYEILTVTSEIFRVVRVNASIKKKIALQYLSLQRNKTMLNLQDCSISDEERRLLFLDT